MDLRRTLVFRLGLVFVVLALALTGAFVMSLRSDATSEQTATLRLVGLLLEPRTPQLLIQLYDAAASGQLRHVRAVHLNDAEVPSEPPFWERLLSRPAGQGESYILNAGGERLMLSSDPGSELREQLTDGLDVLLLLTLFGGVALVLVWYAVDRALSPVKELEVALRSLIDGTAVARPSQYRLREYASMACVIDQVAQSLTGAREEQRRLTRAMIELQDRERRNLAADLHDEIGQSLTVISLSASYICRHALREQPSPVLECAADIASEANRVSAHVRNMLTSLRPYSVAEGGLADILDELVTSWDGRLTGAQIDADIDRLAPASAEVTLTLYRCLQELLTNAIRHSQCRNIRVNCHNDDDAIRLVVADDGVGTLDRLSSSRGCGLAGLRERLAMIGGTFEANVRPGGGLSFLVRIPCLVQAELAPQLP